MFTRLCAATLAVSAGGAAGSLAPQAPEPGGKPQRIVSLNLCTDQLLMQMVEPSRIAAVTYLARDPLYSAMANEARALPLTRGTAEEVIALEPDLILAGPYSTRETVAILRRLGYRVVSVDPASDLPAIETSIAQLAAAIGEPARGAAMIRAIEARVAALPPPPAPGERPVFADYGANGVVSGEGSLITALANRAGFDTLGQRLGIAGARAVPLEQMLVERPDLIDLGDELVGPALATETYRHPAMRLLLRTSTRVDLPAAFTACGTMRTLDALDMLVAARRALR